MLIKAMQTKTFRQLLSITIVLESILLVVMLHNSYKVQNTSKREDIVVSEHNLDTNIFTPEQPTMRSKQLWCKSNTSCRVLAEAGYYEARGEDSIGVVAVMYTILNRVNKNGKWSNTIEGVVYQNKQFSYTHDGSLNRGMSNTKQVQRMYILAYDVMNGLIGNPIGGSDHYHAVNVSPYWAEHLNYTYHIGNHIFYKE